MYYDECGAAVDRPLIRTQFLFSPLLALANFIIQLYAHKSIKSVSFIRL
jgi:hypothetical protein